MAVSRFNQPINYNKYVAPFDLGIFSQVMTTKQAKFDAGVAQVQGGINAVSNLDLYASEDKNYLNQKLNEVVSGVQSLGGQDLSDSSVVNKLSGIVGSVGADRRIIDARTDTVKIRNLESEQAARHKAVMEGKKGVRESVANEFVENLGKQKYLEAKKQDPNARYTGPSQAFSAFDNYKFMQDSIKMMVPEDYNQFSTAANDTLFKTTNGARLTKGKIMQNILSTLPEEGRQQFQRDSMYHFRNATDDEVKDYYIGNTQREVDQLKFQIDHNKALGVITTDKEQTEYNQRLKELTATVDKKRALAIQTLQSGNREGLMFQAYTDKYIGSMADAASYDKQSVKYRDNTYRMFAEKLNQQTATDNRNFKLKEAEFKLEVGKDQRDAFQQAFDNNLKISEANADGFLLDAQGNLIGKSQFYGQGKNAPKNADGSSKTDSEISTNTTGLPQFELSSDKEQATVSTTQQLRVENDSFKQQQANLTRKFYSDFIKANYVVTGEHSDLYDSKQITTDKGTVETVYIPTKKFNIVHQALVNSSFAIQNGKTPQISGLPPSFVQYSKELNELVIQERANNQVIESIGKRAERDAMALLAADVEGINPEQFKTAKAKYEAAQKDPKFITSMFIGSSGFGGQGNTVQTFNEDAYKAKLKPNELKSYEIYRQNIGKFNQKYQEVYKQGEMDWSKRNNSIGVALTKQDLARPEIGNALISEARSKGFYVMGAEGKTELTPQDKNLPAITLDNFTPLGIASKVIKGVSQNVVTGYVETETGTGDSKIKESKTVFIPLSSTLAKNFKQFTINSTIPYERAMEASDGAGTGGVTYLTSVPTPGQDKDPRVYNMAQVRIQKLGEGQGYKVSTLVTTDSQGKLLPKPQYIDIPLPFKTSTEAVKAGQDIIPKFKEAERVYKQQNKRLIFGDFIRQYK